MGIEMVNKVVKRWHERELLLHGTRIKLKLRSMKWADQAEFVKRCDEYGNKLEAVQKRVAEGGNSSLTEAVEMLDRPWLLEVAKANVRFTEPFAVEDYESGEPKVIETMEQLFEEANLPFLQKLLLELRQVAMLSDEEGKGSGSPSTSASEGNGAAAGSSAVTSTATGAGTA